MRDQTEHEVGAQSPESVPPLQSRPSLLLCGVRLTIPLDPPSTNGSTFCQTVFGFFTVTDMVGKAGEGGAGSGSQARWPVPVSGKDKCSHAEGEEDGSQRKESEGGQGVE